MSRTVWKGTEDQVRAGLFGHNVEVAVVWRCPCGCSFVGCGQNTQGKWALASTISLTERRLELYIIDGPGDAAEVYQILKERMGLCRRCRHCGAVDLMRKLSVFDGADEFWEVMDAAERIVDGVFPSECRA